MKKTCGSIIRTGDTFQLPTKCSGELYALWTGPDKIIRCPVCKATWTLDGKEYAD